MACPTSTAPLIKICATTRAYVHQTRQTDARHMETQSAHRLHSALLA